MTNPNNCPTCKHKQHPDGGWCYMFRNEPTGACAQHTGRVMVAFKPDRSPPRVLSDMTDGIHLPRQSFSDWFKNRADNWGNV